MNDGIVECYEKTPFKSKEDAIEYYNTLWATCKDAGNITETGLYFTAKNGDEETIVNVGSAEL